MKKALLTAAVILALVSAAFSAGTADQGEPDADIGKALFHDNSFGSNGKSCDDCHSNGDGFDDLNDRKPSDVAKAASECLTGRMGGPVREKSSLGMLSLMLYLEEEFQEEIGC